MPLTHYHIHKTQVNKIKDGFREQMQTWLLLIPDLLKVSVTLSSFRGSFPRVQLSPANISSVVLARLRDATASLLGRPCRSVVDSGGCHGNSGRSCSALYCHKQNRLQLP